MRSWYPLPDTVRLARPGAAPEERPFEAGEEDLVFRTRAAGFGVDLARRGPLLVLEPAGAGDRAPDWETSTRAVLVPELLPPGTMRPSGIPDHVIAPPAWVASGALRRVPVDMPVEDALLLPDLALATECLHRVDPAEGEVLFLGGADPVNLLVALVARHRPLGRVIGADHVPTRRRRAEWSGATRVIAVPEEPLVEVIVHETARRGVDAAVVTAAEYVAPAIDTLGFGGRLVVCPADGDPWPTVGLPPRLLAERGLTLQGVVRPTRRSLEEAEKVLRQGILDPESLIARRVAYDDLGSLRLPPDYWEDALRIHVTFEE